MLLIKRTLAFAELGAIASDNWDKFSKFIHIIVDNNLQNALDNVVAHEFPNGVEIDELTKFFTEEQDFILEQLGYEMEND